MISVTSNILGAMYLNKIDISPSVCIRYSDQDEEWLNQFFIYNEDLDYIKEIIMTDVENISLINKTDKIVRLKNGIPNLSIDIEKVTHNEQDKIRISVSIPPKRRS